MEDRKQETLRLVEHESNGDPEAPTVRQAVSDTAECDGAMFNSSLIIHSGNRGRLLCSARLAVMLIAVALTLATCSVWLCLDIRTMLRHEAQQVKEIKQMVQTLSSKDYADRPFDDFSQNLAFDYDNGHDDEGRKSNDDDDDEDTGSLYQDLSRDGDADDGLEFVMDSHDDENGDSGDDAGSPSSLDDPLKKATTRPAEFSAENPSMAGECGLVPESWRFDCHPEVGATEQVCLSRGCCWNAAGAADKARAELGHPFCFYPLGYSNYVYLNKTETDTGFTLFLKQTRPTYYPESVAMLKMDVMFETKYRLRIKISDASKQRYEVPVPVLPKVTKAANDTLYDINFYPDWGFQVFRKSTGEFLFDASVGRLIYCNQFIQLSALLPTTLLYGLGEQRDSFVRSFDWQRFTLFNADHVPQENVNLYGTHPFYLLMERSSASHGVFLLNSNAMEIDLTPTPALTFRTIGGVLDFYYFLGPSPDDVISQYTELIGRPFMPPYWGLGFHLCRFNYGTVNKTELVWQRTRDANIPFDVQWNDLDYMVKGRDFTVDKEKFGDLGHFVDKVHSVGMHYVPMVDCGINVPQAGEDYEPYDEGKKMDIFIKDSVGNEFVGKVWPGECVWPDFTNPKTVTYWTQQIQKFYAQVPIDGAWIDMNEPSNFISGTEKGCPNSQWDNPPYVPGVIGNYLPHLTVCMSAQQNASLHYDVHNLYGFTEAIATNVALTSVRNKRPFIISRSTFPGHGHYAGHWTGDISSEWHDLQRSVSDILNFNLFGIPLVGADICGFNGNTTAKLCQRWMELGAFYPFARNHNTDDAIDQDPVALGPEVVTASQKAFTLRYQFLPYLYTLFYKAHVHGTTVARPLFFEFPNDHRTFTIDTQFLWGPALMVLPVLEDEVISASFYFPQGLWYLYPSLVTINSSGLSFAIDTPLDTINIALRGGYILPSQDVNQTTTASRLQIFRLLVALNESGGAEGDIFWDDGDTLGTVESEKYNRIMFHAHQNTVTSTVEKYEYRGENGMTLAEVMILGIQKKPSRITVDGKEWTEYTFAGDSKSLKITDLLVQLEKSFTINWT